jgi:hypothetical protein
MSDSLEQIDERELATIRHDKMRRKRTRREPKRSAPSIGKQERDRERGKETTEGIGR